MNGRSVGQDQIGCKQAFARLLSIPLITLAVSLAPAAEISTNGTGGGNWTDPATWHGKIVPGQGDDVIIRKYDLVTFDRKNSAEPSCNKLLIDPKGVLTFKSGAGKVTLSVTEAIDSYGVIKLDGTKSRDDLFELRLIGKAAAQRKIKLNKGAGLILYGADLPMGQSNVSLTSPRMGDAKDDILGLVEADDGAVSIDWRRAHIQNVKLVAKKIDNTGARQNERFNLNENRFSGLSRVWCQSCDTPVIAKNSFTFSGDNPLEDAAIDASQSPLAEIKGNTIHGRYAVGIAFSSQSDAVIIGNTIEKCATGISGINGVANTMIKQCVIRGSETGIKLEGATGVVEDTQVEGAMTAYYQQEGTLQLTNFQANKIAPKGVGILYGAGKLSLLNSNIEPGQIKMEPSPHKLPPAPITCLQYVVVGINNAPADAVVELAPVVAGAPEEILVRNSPAPIANGLTPLPKSSNTLIVQAWSLDKSGKPLPAPKYTLKILGRNANDKATRPVLHTMTFQPQGNALRATADDPTPTLKVNLK